MDLSGKTIVGALQQQFGISRVANTHPHLRLEEAFNDIAGRDALEIFGIKQATLRRFLGTNSYFGPVNHPFQIMAAIQVTFGGLSAFSKAIAPKEDKSEMVIQLEQPDQKRYKSRPPGCRALKGDAYVARFKSYSFIEQKRITREAREWLLELIAANPLLNRDMANKIKGNNRRKYHLRHLSLVDMEWYDRTLPPILPNGVKHLPTEQDISMAVAHIRARYDYAIATRPLDRITKTALITHLACESSPNLVLRSPEVVDAIVKYADDISKRRIRVTHWICTEVQKRQPSHPYADFERYASRTDQQFRVLIHQAKRWLDKFDKL